MLSMLIPAAAAALAWIFLDEAVTIVQGLGIVLTLTALIAITRAADGPTEPLTDEDPVETSNVI